MSQATTTTKATTKAAAEDAPSALELVRLVGRSNLGPIGAEKPLSFSLASGQVGVVLGGKDTSSLFRLIMGIGQVESGEIRLHGRVALSADAREEDIRLLRQEIGFAFRDKGLISNLTIRDNVDLPAKYHGRYTGGVRRGSYGEAALAELGVEEKHWDVRPSRISGELRKRVLLARAVVLAPKVLILDDPSALVASVFLPELLAWIGLQKAKGTAILIGTNDLPVGLAAADWVLHPQRLEPVTAVGDFIDSVWIRSAALLATTGRAA
jgi:ABC-type transporter Mla maintaining outer membrane lipid asymmetry ATPase subunit MlaF